MLRLASDEASEIRAQCRSRSCRDDSRSPSRRSRSTREAIRAQGRRSSRTAARRWAEHERTMIAARNEAAAHRRRGAGAGRPLAAEAEAKREQIQQDFDITMAERRDQAVDGSRQTRDRQQGTKPNELLETPRRSRSVVLQRCGTGSPSERVANAHKNSPKKCACCEAASWPSSLRSAASSTTSRQMLAAVNRESELLDSEHHRSAQQELSDNARLDEPSSSTDRRCR